jgi:hypothetical protein
MGETISMLGNGGHFNSCRMMFDFKLMYGFFQEQGLKGTLSDIERLTGP